MQKTKREKEIRLGRTKDRSQLIRTGSVFVRAAHLVGAGVVLGAFVLREETTVPLEFLYLVTISGFLLLLMEWARHIEIWREFSGWVVIVKLVLLGFVPIFDDHAWWFVAASFIIAAIGSHLPKKYRHRVLF